MVSINGNAMRIVEKMMAEREILGIDVRTLSCGTRLLDCTRGGLEAGRRYAEVCLGGLGKVSFGRSFHVKVWTDHPRIACMASQYAGWNIEVRYKKDGEEKKFSASASGPARSLARAEKLFEEIGYADSCKKAVLALEVKDFPQEILAEFVAEKCEVTPENLYILYAPTASIVGSVQVSARVVEVGLHKLRILGFNLLNAVSAFGSAPVAPVGRDDMDAMGKTNDCILYGGEAFYHVSCDDSEIEGIMDRVPSSSSKEYGRPFGEIFKQADFQFYNLDASLFSPASVTINNMRTGRTWKAGKMNREILEKSLYSC